VRILLIEDDESKERQIVAVLLSAYPDAELEIARSLQTGQRAATSSVFSIVLLDMTLPSFDVGPNESGEPKQHFGGRDIIRQMQRKHVAVPVIMVTQFDRFGVGSGTITKAELEGQLARAFPSLYRGAVYYRVDSADWKPELVRLIAAYALAGGDDADSDR
jgi:CheY-like chemotaxis protein